LLDIFQPLRQLVDLGFGHLSHFVVVRLGNDLARTLELRGGRAIVAISGHHRRELGQLLRHHTRAVGIDSYLRIRLLRQQALVFFRNLFQPLKHWTCLRLRLRRILPLSSAFLTNENPREG